VLLGFSLSLPVKIVQEEMPLRTLFKPVWDSDPKKIILSHVPKNFLLRTSATPAVEHGFSG
jgi:hypothetical protein